VIPASVAYLASPAAASMTGQVLVLDGGFDGGMKCGAFN
jgi:hypothetical protein